MKSKVSICIAFFLFFNMPVYSSGIIDITQSRWKVKVQAKTKGFNYYVLKRGKDIPLLPKTIYELGFDYDLKGSTITFPDSCYVRFVHHGRIHNGHIKGRLLNSSISVDQLGAVADGSVDCSSIIQEAINLTDFAVVFSKGLYRVDDYVSINRNHIALQGENTTILFSPQKEATPGILVLNAVDCTISRIAFISDKRFPVYHSLSPKKGLSSNRLSIIASGVIGFSVQDCTFKNMEYAVKIDGRNGMSSKISLFNLRTDSSVHEPIYISHARQVLIKGCSFDSDESSTLNHHIYGSGDSFDHVIEQCFFSGGNSIPIHYFAGDGGCLKNIIVRNCSFQNTCGLAIVSSNEDSLMMLDSLSVNSSRRNDNALIRAYGRKTQLVVSNLFINAPNQALLNIPSGDVSIESISAEVGLFSYSLPSSPGKLTMTNSRIGIHSGKQLISITEKDSARLGDICISNNIFVIDSAFDAFIKIRGKLSHHVIFDTNSIISPTTIKKVIEDSNSNARFLSVKNIRIMSNSIDN